jgi:type I restriction enzyme S subunit
VEYGAAQKQFNIGHAVQFLFPFPPIEEQRKIVEFVETETSKIGSTITKIENEIELLHEYRTALISEAVTGKIKVV